MKKITIAFLASVLVVVCAVVYEQTRPPEVEAHSSPTIPTTTFPQLPKFPESVDVEDQATGQLFTFYKINLRPRFCVKAPCPSLENDLAEASRMGKGLILDGGEGVEVMANFPPSYDPSGIPAVVRIAMSDGCQRDPEVNGVILEGSTLTVVGSVLTNNTSPASGACAELYSWQDYAFFIPRDVQADSIRTKITSRMTLEH